VGDTILSAALWLSASGARTLSAPLRAFADFLRIDNDLMEVAAAGSPPPVELSLGEDFKRWASALPESEKTALLVQLTEEGEPSWRNSRLNRDGAGQQGNLSSRFTVSNSVGYGRLL